MCIRTLHFNRHVKINLNVSIKRLVLIDKLVPYVFLRIKQACSSWNYFIVSLFELYSNPHYVIPSLVFILISSVNHVLFVFFVFFTGFSKDLVKNIVFYIIIVWMISWQHQININQNVLLMLLLWFFLCFYKALTNQIAWIWQINREGLHYL